MIITIDGPSGTGKSTVARLVAEKLGFLYFDSGALYRLVALHCLNQRIDLEDNDQIIDMLESFNFDIKNISHEYVYFLDQKNVTEAIRQPKISTLASLISKNNYVREKLLPLQRNFANKHSIVMEGRDIGTTVFPSAELKVFLSASTEERAKRRFDQLKLKFPYETFDYEKILDEQLQRDHQDQSRALAPLKQAPDAVYIDTTYLSKDEVVEKIIGLYNSYGKKHTTSMA